ncbi:MAG: 50S ribosomal protein L3 [Patescibacteria group bacterium]
MTLNTILGQKKEQSQKFLEDGTRIPVTRILVKGNVVTNVRIADKHKYSAIQLGFGVKKNATKSVIGNTKGALEQAPNFLKEVRIDADTDLSIGTMINASEVLAEGDIIDITGVSKGKGYAGVVKRHGFHGGPKTHGQSDRHRAPGSIGQGTTPGRVYKGKRMAGRMGNENVTIRNLVVVGVTEDEVLIKGLVPGSVNTMVIVKKVGANKKFVPLFKDKTDEVEVAGDLPVSDDAKTEEILENGQPQVSSDVQPAGTENPTNEQASLSGNQSTEIDDNTKEDSELVSDSLETGSTDSQNQTSGENKKEEAKEEKKEEVENAG